MRTAIYARVSTEIQAKEGDSIQSQIDALRKYAKDHNYTVVGEYIDDGISGTKLTERDELQRMLDDVKADLIDLVIFTKLDRYFRSLKHYLNTQEVLDAHNVAWRAIWENHETVTPQGRLMVSQMLSFAQFEAENTGVRIDKVFEYKKQKHEALSGKHPFGYMIDNKHYVPDPTTADLARQVFDIYLATGSLCETLRQTKDWGVPKTQRAMKMMLQNRKYIGECYGIEDYCEPIIDRETFDLVQEKLKRNVKKPRKYDYIFTGLVYCSDCKRRMTGQTQEYHKMKTRYKVYACSFHFRTIPTCTNPKCLNEAKMEKYLVENLKNLVFAEIHEGENKKHPNYEKQIEAIERKIARVKDLYVNELIGLDEYKADVERYKADIERIRVDMRKYSTKTKNALKQLVGTNIEDWYWTLSVPEKRTLWSGVIDKIWYGSDKKIKVDFL